MKIKVYKLSLVSNISNLSNLESCKTYFESLIKYKTEYTKAKKTNHRFSIRKGQKLGFKLNLYGSRIKQFISNIEGLSINGKSIDPYGNLNMGIYEYHQIKDLVHNPDLANFGFCINIHFSYDGLYVKGVKNSMTVDKQAIKTYIKENYKNITIR